MVAGVITSDIIQSTHINPPERQRLYAEIQQAIKEIGKKYPLKSEWYRGDAFQVKTDEIKYACRVALLIKTFTRSVEKDREQAGKKSPKIYDVRMAVGIGPIESGSDTLALSNGEAFQLSGRTLDELKGARRHFAFATADGNNNSLQIESQLLDALINSTTAAQCRVLYNKLLGHIEDDIAKKLGVSQSTVNQHANAANWSVFSDYLDYFENLYK
ncbi:hypothetical protein [Flavobacterium beibuense]|uniref:Fumarate hydratase n=1 Tax=Flavobacterium beibuense TaxID=657326 RepID=A0A444WFB4_9FLAO|nr:hypothetical protein [Flavobacterium beibuense]RYJ44517.1 Fumarate hydratase [Flavobacterium beibuense]